jgi:hypothetical protein
VVVAGSVAISKNIDLEKCELELHDVERLDKSNVLSAFLVLGLFLPVVELGYSCYCDNSHRFSSICKWVEVRPIYGVKIQINS